MKSRAIYSDEPARGWIPWGVLAPVLAFVFVVAPLFGITVAFQHFRLADELGAPIGVNGLIAFLLCRFLPSDCWCSAGCDSSNTGHSPLLV